MDNQTPFAEEAERIRQLCHQPHTAKWACREICQILWDLDAQLDGTALGAEVKDALHVLMRQQPAADAEPRLLLQTGAGRRLQDIASQLETASGDTARYLHAKVHGFSRFT